MNPREILGVASDASEEDIKKAYKKLAMEWHPDRHGGSKEAEEKFKEINVAYQVLTGKMKDKKGAEPTDEELFEFMRSGGGFDPFLGGLSDMFFAAHTQVRLLVQISLEEAYMGAKRSVRYTKRAACQECGGTGREISEVPCSDCGGRGKSRTSTSNVFVIHMSCGACLGRGKKLGESCPHCLGKRAVTTQHKTSVEIPAGAHEGDTFMAADGSIVVVEYAPHAFLKLMPGTLDTHGDIDTDLFDLLLGGATIVRTLAGDMRIKIEPGLRPGSQLRIKGAGMRDKPGNKGDHVVQVWARMPKLTEDQKQVLEKIRTETNGEHE